MSDRPSTIVPRRRRDERAPTAPMDPYVTQLVRWIAAQDGGVSLSALPRLAAAELTWPLPFAEAVVTATRTRRLLTVSQVAARGAYKAHLSKRGREWIDLHQS